MTAPSKREVCFLLGKGGEILWSDASTSPVLLPDSRDRWEAIWSRKDELAEIAHSHPVGPLAFSHEDETTMAALDDALGRRLVFSVVAPNGRIVRHADEAIGVTIVQEEPWWVALLRLASGVTRDSVAFPPEGA